MQNQIYLQSDLLHAELHRGEVIGPRESCPA